MKRNHFILSTFLLIGLLFTLTTFSNVHAQMSRPVVHAILFYSPTCPHCHKVMTEDLPLLFEKYSEQLEIIGIDVSKPSGQTLYQAAIYRFSIPENRLGVPTLIVDNIVLVGSLEIPDQFPGLVNNYLAQGGVGWPDIPGLSEVLPQPPRAGDSTAIIPSQTVADLSTATNPRQSTALQTTPVPATVSPSTASLTPTPTQGLILTDNQNPGWGDKFLRDPAGNSLSVLVLFGMLGALIWTVKLFRSRTRTLLRGYWIFGIPILCLVGFFVAGYLAYVETSQVTAVCGPVGDCNTVQQSEYARLFGILPIGVLGLAGYGLIAIAWLVACYANYRLASLSAISIFVLTFFGTLFSIYLTFLEPFVIGATCAWCLTSAVLMTSLMLLSLEPAKLALFKKPLHGSLRRKFS